MCVWKFIEKCWLIEDYYKNYFWADEHVLLRYYFLLSRPTVNQFLAYLRTRRSSPVRRSRYDHEIALISALWCPSSASTWKPENVALLMEQSSVRHGTRVSQFSAFAMIGYYLHVRSWYNMWKAHPANPFYNQQFQVINFNLHFESILFYKPSCFDNICVILNLCIVSNLYIISLSIKMILSVHSR